MEWNDRRILVDVGSAQTCKFATTRSGDDVAIADCGGSGVAMLLVDGQGSGPAARRISRGISSEMARQLSDGVRETVVVQAAHDRLHAQRGGQVSATVDVVVADVAAGRLRCCRQTNTPLVSWDNGTMELRESTSTPIGQPSTENPQIVEYPLMPGRIIAIVSDGIATAGTRYGVQMDWSIFQFTAAAIAQHVADEILERAIELDRGKPHDDLSVAVLVVREEPQRLPTQRHSATFAFGAPS